MLSYGGLKPQDVKLKKTFLCVLLEKWPLTVKFSKFCSESFYCESDRRVVFRFREIWPTENRWNRALLIPDKKKSKFRLALQLLLMRWSRPKSARASPRQCTKKCSKFHPNRFTFSGVYSRTREHHHKRRKVNPIFDWSPVSSWIITMVVS